MTCVEAMGCRLLAVGVGLLVAACGLWDPTGPRFVITGSLVDDEGRAIACAVVSDGEASTLTDDRGRYRLGLRGEAVTASKPLHASLSWVPDPGAQPTRTLDRSARLPAVAFSTQEGAAGFRGLASHVARGGRVFPWPGTGLNALDALLLVTPRGWTAAEVRAVLDWVRRGGRLILCGEWGGYAGQDPETMRALAAPAGVDVTGGTVRTAAEDAFAVTVPRPSWQALAASLGGQPVTLFGAADLALSGEARPLLIARRGYVVLAVGTPRVLAAVAPLGYGKVMVIGDSSLWRDEASLGGGQANIALGGNGPLLEALLVW
ncbi:MAG: DUF4350 domain-containing protein [Candidatus Sericytochromatia bacterium]|nr:DUF4350 domain-containing protein [Candidatus Sericytochromatia bacterium]